MEVDKNQSWLELTDEDDALLNEAICMSSNELGKIIEANKGSERTQETLEIELSEKKPCIDNIEKQEKNSNSNAHINNRLQYQENKLNSANGIKYADNVKNKPEDVHSVRKRPREMNVNHDDSKVARIRSYSDSSSTTNSSENSKRSVEYETDPKILARRQKEIDYGKNTIGYDRYIQAVPKEKRTKEHPRTPPKYIKYSRRGWDGMVKLWRKQLHQWDPPEENGNDD
ncbi:stem-loop binding protein [Calliopsis andreniformis]|uniref:stem-loop binding protein n=1 Tax=Calliopsis andreniformis TaxID=337506 RepID=UPI003FCC823E